MIHIPPLPLQLPLQLQLPLLIKEKVEFYYYRQLWLEKIKIMHEQYRKCVKMKGDSLTWTDYGKNEIEGIRFICAIGGFYYKKYYIYNFTREPRLSEFPWSTWIPRKYWYSSGLNNPTGYK
ncbi:MAG: hypothetical protein WD512_14245 [Candidatus Paceibacterota bacterium]